MATRSMVPQFVPGERRVPMVPQQRAPGQMPESQILEQPAAQPVAKGTAAWAAPLRVPVSVPQCGPGRLNFAASLVARALPAQ